MYCCFLKLGTYNHVGLWGYAFKVTCYDFQMFGNLSLDGLLQHVFEDARDFCRRNHLQLHMNALTKDLLGIKRASNYPRAILT